MCIPCRGPPSSELTDNNLNRPAKAKRLAVDFTVLPHSLLKFHHAQLHMRMTDQKLLMSHQGSNDDRHIIPMDFQSLSVNMSCKMKVSVFFYIHFIAFLEATFTH